MTPTPRLAISIAALCPMPELAPVTMATFMVVLPGTVVWSSMTPFNRPDLRKR